MQPSGPRGAPGRRGDPTDVDAGGDPPDRRYRRSPYCILTWAGDTLMARDATSHRRFAGAERYLTILVNLGEWRTAEELAARLSAGSPASLRAPLERLVGMGLVMASPIPPPAPPAPPAPSPARVPLAPGRTPPAPGPAPPPAPGPPSWDLIELAFQRQGTGGGYDPTRSRPPTAPPGFKRPPAGGIALSRQGLDRSCSLASALDRRRTIRALAAAPLSLGQLGQFLYATARVTRDVTDGVAQESRRPYPSGGARHPLEIYPVVNAVDGLDAGAHWYDARRHMLHALHRPAPGVEALNEEVRLATGGAISTAPPVVLVVTAVFGRTMWKYDRTGLSLILKDVGGLFQTMYLVATAMGLAPCAIGGGREADNARWLGLDPLVESQVGSFVLGHPEPRVHA